MTFHSIADEGCRSCMIGCAETGFCAVIDLALGQIDRYPRLIAREGMALAYVVETHTQADHFTATRGIRQRTGAPVVMHAKGGASDVELRVEQRRTDFVILDLSANAGPGRRAAFPAFAC